VTDQLPLELQSRYEKPEHVGAPYAIGSDTSKAAAKKVAKRVALQQTEVYRAIIRSGEDGATWDELVAQYGFSPTANGRVTRLVEMGLVVDSGKRRPTRTGCKATVWTAAPPRNGETR
jgi:hypothetical protein